MPICVTVTFKHVIRGYNEKTEEMEKEYRCNTRRFNPELHAYVEEHCTLVKVRECRDEMLISVMEEFKEDGLPTPTVYISEDTRGYGTEEPTASFTIVSDACESFDSSPLAGTFTYWGANGGENFKIGDKDYVYEIDVEFGGGGVTSPTEAVKKVLGGEEVDSTQPTEAS